MRIWDGSCRGDNAGHMVELLEDHIRIGEKPEMTVEEIGERMHRCTRYVCTLVEDFDILHFVETVGRKKDYIVGLNK